MAICGKVQQQNCDVLVDIRYRDTPDVSKIARCFLSFFLQTLDCKFINNLYMNKVNMARVKITHEWRFLCMGLAVFL